VIASLLPLGVLMSFIAMRYSGVDANVMALGGIAIAIGVMVDMGIVFTENIVSHVEAAPPGADRRVVVKRAAGEVAGAVMTSLLTTILGFVPIFGLTGAEGKLFGPLAYTKTFALVSAFLIALIVLPALAHLLIRAKSEVQSLAGKRFSKRLFSRQALFDWVILGAGLSLIGLGLGLAGAVVSGIAAVRLGEPALPTRWRWTAHAAANGLTVIAITLALTDYWMPLGPQRSLFANVAFVVVMIASLMVLFWTFQRFYTSILAWCLRNKLMFLSANVLFVAFGALTWLGTPKLLGWLPDSAKDSNLYVALEETAPGLKDDFMPPFDEGSFLFMPTTTPHASIGQSKQMIAAIDAAIAAIPEVDRAVGKLGRAESPLDPAPISMFETVVNYHSEYKMDDDGHIGTYEYDEDEGEFVRDRHGNAIEDENGRPLRQWREHIRSPDDIWDEIVVAAEYPGLTGSPKLMPIKTRIVMLQSGMRSAVGMKVAGPDLETIEKFGLEVETILKEIPELEAKTVLADRIVGKPYLEIDIDREAISRFGLSIVDVQDVIGVAIGGKMLTRTVEGRERYPVRVRYMREERSTVEGLGRILIPGRSGEQIPLSQLAEIRYLRGPQMIRSEDTFLNGYVTFDPAKGIGEVEAVHVVQNVLEKKIAAGALTLPDGVSYRFAGTYENQVRSAKRLMVLVPIALSVIFLLLYLQFRRTSTALMVFSGLLLAAAGGFLIIWAYGKPWFMNFEPMGIDIRGLFRVGDTRMTVAVWVGFIALFGVATDNGVIVATYLTQRFRDHLPETIAGVHERVIEAGSRRVRPCLMTTATTMLALLPIVTSPGRGSDLMVPMALPTVGGISLSLVTLLTVPVLYAIAEERRLRARKAKPS
jgi:Cu(I)/Ag(I) efflux system membrane protein CusA/SilA